MERIPRFPNFQLVASIFWRGFLELMTQPFPRVICDKDIAFRHVLLSGFRRFRRRFFFRYFRTSSLRFPEFSRVLRLPLR